MEQHLINIFYFFNVIFVKILKNLRTPFLLLFPKTVERYVRSMFRRAGIYIHKTYEKGSDDPRSKNMKHIEPWDVKAHDKSLFVRLSIEHTMAMGETYLEKMWDCDDLVEFSYRILRGGMLQEVHTFWNGLMNYLELCTFNLQTKYRAWEVGKKHYDIGNDLFQSFLDPTMNYSCGYWAKADNLNQAQKDKMELIAKKLKLKPGMTVLDIGCGWGGLIKYLAEEYDVKCVGITVSKEGAKTCREWCQHLPVHVLLMDYRDLYQKFDRIVSVGMFEHVGSHNYREFMNVCHRCLKDDGILLLHTIGLNHPDMFSTEPWFHTYIFPNGMLPYYLKVAKALEGLFIIEDWHNFGHDYSKTLLAWRENFQKNWPQLSQKYDERFYRMWHYYFSTAAGAFKSRKIQLWQIVLSKNGVLGGYQAPR